MIFFIDHFAKEEWGNQNVEGLMNAMQRDERHFCEEGETSITMAIESVQKLLEDTNTDPNEIDGIVFASDTPEYCMPANASKIAAKLSINKQLKFFLDINANCLGMVEGLDTVSCLMKQKSYLKNVFWLEVLYSLIL